MMQGYCRCRSSNISNSRSANLLKLLSRYYCIFLHTSTIIDASLACPLDIKRVSPGIGGNLWVRIGYGDTVWHTVYSQRRLGNNFTVGSLYRKITQKRISNQFSVLQSYFRRARNVIGIFLYYTNQYGVDRLVLFEIAERVILGF